MTPKPPSKGSSPTFLTAGAGRGTYTRLTRRRLLSCRLPNVGGILFGVALGLAAGALISSAYSSREQARLRETLSASCEAQRSAQLASCLDARGEVTGERDNALARVAVCERDLADYKERKEDAFFRSPPSPLQESLSRESPSASAQTAFDERPLPDLPVENEPPSVKMPPKPPKPPLRDVSSLTSSTSSSSSATSASPAVLAEKGGAIGKATDSFTLSVGDERTLRSGAKISLIAVSRRNNGQFCIIGGSDFNGARVPSGKTLSLQRGKGTTLVFSATVIGADKCSIVVEER